MWHDGNIKSLNYSINKNGVTLEIKAEFYSTDKSPRRDDFTIKCEGVTRFNNVIDFVEIIDNFSAGSVSDGYLKENTIWLYLTDGIIEINAKNINVSKH